MIGTSLCNFLQVLCGFKPPFSALSPAEREAVKRFAKNKKSVAEIGVFQGVTTAVMRTVMHPQGVLVAVDPFASGRLGFSYNEIIAHRHVDRISNGKVIWIKDKQRAARQKFEGLKLPRFDFLLIDADHTYEGLQVDWAVWHDAVTKGGVVALHDSISSETRVIDELGSVVFTKEVVLNDSRFAFVCAVDTMVIMQKLID
ncbi:MAG: class I SAM-dependent methyltransferase [Candidatus Omnitrophica bacterium]|nr:class I SAM-dependent methyltransferase [Candidatus Omnitrophota bacterium]